MIAKGQQNEPEPPEKSGGFGGGTEYPLGHKNELAKLEGRALKWNVKPEWREAILSRQVKTAIDPASTPRDSTRAAKFILDCDKHNHDIDNPNKGQLNVAVQTNVSTGHGGDADVSVSDMLRHTLDTDPDYLDYVRSKELAIDCDAGPVREDGQRGPLEDGEASRGT